MTLELLLLNFRCLHITDSWSRSGTGAKLDCISDWDCVCFSRTFARWMIPFLICASYSC